MKAHEFIIASAVLDSPTARGILGMFSGTPVRPANGVLVFEGPSGCGKTLNGFRLRGPELAPNVLVTGFGPFPGVAVNPSKELLRSIYPGAVDGITLCTLLLPVSFSQASWIVSRAIDALDPQVLLMFGVDASENHFVKLERFARNVWQPDAHHAARAIDTLGPPVYQTRLPLDPAVRTLNAAGIPAAISDSAGSYVCNFVFYSAAKHVHLRGLPTLYGFVHVPLPPVLPGTGPWAAWMSRLVDAFWLILREALVTPNLPGWEHGHCCRVIGLINESSTRSASFRQFPAVCSCALRSAKKSEASVLHQ